MLPRFDGFYLAGPIEDYFVGQLVEETHYCFLKFFENGLWLSKESANFHFDFFSYLATVPDELFQEGLTGHHPVDECFNLVHLVGRFTIQEDRSRFELQHNTVNEHE